MEDVTGRRTDVEDGASEWLSLSDAAPIVGRTERTLRRYASGEIRTPAGLEFDTSDGRVRVRMTDGLGRRTDTDGRSVRPSEPLLHELEATRSLLQEKEIVIAGLEASVDGKDKLIERLETDLDRSHQSVEHLEILLSQLQKALPAPAEEAIEATVRRPLLWLWILLAVLGLAGILGGLVWYIWYMRWIP